MDFAIRKYLPRLPSSEGMQQYENQQIETILVREYCQFLRVRTKTESTEY